MVFVGYRTILQIQPSSRQLLRVQSLRTRYFYIAPPHQRKRIVLRHGKLRTYCQSSQPSSNPADFEQEWIKAEESEIATLLEHDFHIETDPRKIEWPPNESRYDPEELKRRYAPHVSYDPVPLSSENLPLLWDTPRLLSLLRLVIYIPFLSFLILKNHILCDCTLILSTWLTWLRKKSETFVQCQATFLTFLEPFVDKSMFWSCLIGVATQENNLWVLLMIWLLIPIQSFTQSLREWTTYCGRRFEVCF